MIDFVSQNGGTVLVSIVLILIVMFNVKKLCKEKSTCGCGCSNCPSNGNCHKPISGER